MPLQYFVILGVLLWICFAWTLVRLLLVLIESKSIYRNRELKEVAERNRLKEINSRYTENKGCCEKVKNIWKDIISAVSLKIKYIGIPILNALSTVIFRLTTLWLILSYSSELYPNSDGSGPGLGLFLPFCVLGIILLVNFAVGTKILDLRWQEALVNSNSYIFLPVYFDLFFLVSSVITSS